MRPLTYWALLEVNYLHYPRSLLTFTSIVPVFEYSVPSCHIPRCIDRLGFS